VHIDRRANHCLETSFLHAYTLRPLLLCVLCGQV
jgi:hypothetical protein